MHIPFVDLAAQYSALKEEIDAAIASVVAESAYIGTRSNRFVTEFESKFASYSGAKYCVGCGNGTDALEILLRAVGIGPGDEVIVPALTWIATSEAATNVGAHTVFADINPSTCTIDPKAVETVLSERTKAIIPVHLYGLPADMDPIMDIAKKHDLYVIEDCAQAHGAEYKGRKVGTIGHAGSFSFFPGKNLGAYGDAGGIITDDEELARRARMIGQHGQSDRKFEHEIEGRNSRLDGLQAAILNVKLKYIEEWTARRIEIANLYRQQLSDLPMVLPTLPDERRHVYHLFAVRVSNRNSVRASLRDVGISTGQQYPIALPLLEAYASRSHQPEHFPNAHAMSKHVLTLPIYPELTDNQMQFIVSKLADILT
jgi:dTDP-4-amino-4,6-dideoxygalactose transaminase